MYIFIHVGALSSVCPIHLQKVFQTLTLLVAVYQALLTAPARATVSGVTEGGHPFEEITVVRDLALQGALLSMAHCPRLQSELQITMDTPGVDGPKEMKLRGYVVRVDSNEGKEHSAVGVVFTE